MVTKLVGAIFIISFWLIFPMLVMFMGSTDYISVDSSLGDDVTEVNIVVKMITVYFTILFLYIPNAPFYINTFVFIFKIVSMLIAYLLIRGD